MNKAMEKIVETERHKEKRWRNGEDCSDGMILFPTIVSYSTLMLQPHDTI